MYLYGRHTHCHPSTFEQPFTTLVIKPLDRFRGVIPLSHRLLATSRHTRYFSSPHSYRRPASDIDDADWEGECNVEFSKRVPHTHDNWSPVFLHIPPPITNGRSKASGGPNPRLRQGPAR